MAFSTSSLTTDAGRSTTSPAAIWFARSAGRRSISELDLNRQPACARVDGILDELLDDGCRPLDNLAGGDLVREVRGKAMDLRARSESSAGVRPRRWHSRRAP